MSDNEYEDYITPSKSLKKTRKRNRRRRTYVKMHVHNGLRAAPRRRATVGRLLLSNIGKHIDCDLIYAKFCKFGTVGKIIIHATTNLMSLGTAEVWMDSSIEANKAQKNLDATPFSDDGSFVRVEILKDNKVDSFWKKILQMCVPYAQWLPENNKQSVIL